jgi:hypothetical protein
VALLELLAAGVVPSLAYLGVGLRLLRPLGVTASGAERLALGFVFGTGAASLAILLLRAVDVPLPLPVWAAVAAVAAFWPRSGTPGAVSAEAPSAGWVRGVDGATLVVAGLSFAAALAPETAWDGFEYPLPLVSEWSTGPIRALPALIDAEFRAGIDLLFVPAVSSGQPDAAAAVTAGFALALAALIRAEASRRASPAAGALAGFFALIVPFAVESAPTTYTDLGVGAYGFVALLYADRWNRGGGRGTLLVAALCLGFAVNAKLHAAILCPAALAIATLGGRRPPLRLLAACAAVVALVVTPWFVKVALTTGNPFFPFLGAWLGTGPTDAQNITMRRLRLLANYSAPRDFGGLLQYLASLSFGRNPHVSGMIGPLPLALAPLALRRLSRATATLSAVLALLVVLQFFYMPALRFGTPLLPFVAIAAALGGQRLASQGRAARGVLALALALTAAHHLWGLGVLDLPRVAALADPRAYERAVAPDQDALREMVARAEPVVGIPMGAVSWMPQPVYNLLWERNGELYFFGTLVWERHGELRRFRGTPPPKALALLRRRGVRSLVLDVEAPLPRDGTLRHPIVDVWLRSGDATLARDVEPLPARAGRVWVLVRLAAAPGALAESQRR